MKKLVIILAAVLFVLLLTAVILSVPPKDAPAVLETAGPTQPSTQPTAPESTEAPTVPVVSTEPPETLPPTEPPAEPTDPPFIASCTTDTDPANWEVDWGIIVDGKITESYTREEKIFFNEGDYFALPGISTFRGDNYRTDASYGTVDVSNPSLSKIWSMNVGYLSGPEWGGCCWTGQPLVVQWDAETKAIMNLYEDKKAKEDLVEVIYAKADGYVHFFDMDDGSYTRDPVYVGMEFKGSGAVDPRGYPILYVGAGLTLGGKQQCIYAISLIDGSKLYERSGYEELAPRYWFGFDGAPLVDAETDTLIWAGESGILYTIKLNTQYDKAAGTITMNPEEPVMARYSDKYTKQGRNAGYESSVTAVENYLYLGDNAGLLKCVDVNTMEVIWTQSIVDDINATPVFDWGKDGNGYLYTAPSMDYAGYYDVDLPICKLDARTGEILWTYTVSCSTDSSAPGGILATPILGREDTDLEDLIIFSVGRTPNIYVGRVIALNKETGEVVWEYKTNSYMWSSPVALYTESGKSYIFQADASGVCYLLDGATGKEVDRYDVDVTVEASPVAFGNKIMLGSRPRIFLFEID